MERKTHYFYAVKLPDEAKKVINEKCGKLRELFPFKRWVYWEDYHITLAFLGNGSKNQIEESVELVADAVKNEQSFQLAINKLDVFGRTSSPRIFWAGVEKEKRLFRLRDLVFEACENARFQLDKRPFSPHITIARKWDGSGEFSKQALLETDPFLKEPFVFQVKEAVLYQTHMGRKPSYEAIEAFPLK